MWNLLRKAPPPPPLVGTWNTLAAHAQLPHHTHTLVVFDFDCTLTSKHMYHTLRTEKGQEWARRDMEGFLMHLFGGADRLRKLRDFLTRLAELPNTDLLVVSFGLEEEIRRALSELGLAAVLPEVYGAESYRRFGITSVVGSKLDLISRVVLAREERRKVPAQTYLGHGADHQWWDAGSQHVGRSSFAHYRVLFADDDRGNFPSQPTKRLDRFAHTHVPVSMVAFPAGHAREGDGLSVGEMFLIERHAAGAVGGAVGGGGGGVAGAASMGAEAAEGAEGAEGVEAAEAAEGEGWDFDEQNDQASNANKGEGGADEGGADEGGVAQGGVDEGGADEGGADGVGASESAIEEGARADEGEAANGDPNNDANNANPDANNNDDANTDGVVGSAPAPAHQAGQDGEVWL